MGEMADFYLEHAMFDDEREDACDFDDFYKSGYFRTRKNRSIPVTLPAFANPSLEDLRSSLFPTKEDKLVKRIKELERELDDVKGQLDSTQWYGGY